ncbi:helix-turn-helix domain-containing protein [Chloroflexota bacterium]
MNWSQENLARKISVSLSTVQRWEKRGGKPIRLARNELEKLFKNMEVGNK